MATRTILVLDPTARSMRKRSEMAVRPENLEGKVMGLLWNGKPGGDVLLETFAEHLNRRFHLAQVLNLRKPSSALGIDNGSLFEFSRKCDLVIIAVAD